MDNGFVRELTRWGPQARYGPLSHSQAQGYCARLARSHYENFSVATLLLPRRLTPHFHAIYAYCRWADDLGDETGGGATALNLLAWWRDELRRCYAGSPRHPVMIALKRTIDRFAIPQEPFLDLLTAFEQDQTVKRYETHEQLLGYCRCSANPVGRLVLYLCECFDDDNAGLSDSICTGLQLANFWQDVNRDLDIGRVYLPAEDRRRFGYGDTDLEARRFTPGFADLMRFEVERTRRLFEAGLPLIERVPAEVRSDIELFAQGGLGILRKIEAIGYNVWQTRPMLHKWEKATLVARVFLRGKLTTKSTNHTNGTRNGAVSFHSSNSCDSWSVSNSYRYCEEIARREAGNFYPAFLLLPPVQRRSMCALYAFMRIADDLSDEAGPVETKRERLAEWRAGLRLALAGFPRHRCLPALMDTVRRYSIPVKYLEALIDGVEMDLTSTTYHTLAELCNYCYHVASVVGLACIHIWGFRGEEALRFAEDAGIAFQLTNILRDLGEDANRARVYLPVEDLERFAYDATRLQTGTIDEPFRALMRFEIDRARSFYQSGWRLVPCLSPPGRAVFLMMARTYRGLLDEIERRDFDVFRSRARVPKWKKALFAMAALPARFEWM